MFGKPTMQKVADVQAAVAVAQQNILEREDELAKLRRELGAYGTETTTLQLDLAREMEAQAKAEDDNQRMIAEIAQVKREVEQVRLQTRVAKAGAEDAAAEKQQLFLELATCEETIRDEQAATDASAKQARQSLLRLRHEQEEERRRWQQTRKANEELQRQVSISHEQCTQARADRDVVKAEWAVTREELRDLQTTNQRLVETNAESEAFLAQQHGMSILLEQDLKRLKEELVAVSTTRVELNRGHQERQTELSSAAGDLSRKKHLLTKELHEFYQRLEEAKVHRDRVKRDHEKAREPR